MHRGLPCQTDLTPDARELYAAEVEACEDCQPVGEVIWLVQAALEAADGLDGRRRPAMLVAPGAARKHSRQG